MTHALRDWGAEDSDTRAAGLGRGDSDTRAAGLGRAAGLATKWARMCDESSS